MFLTNISLRTCSWNSKGLRSKCVLHQIIL